MHKTITTGDFAYEHVGRQILVYDANNKPLTTGILTGYAHYPRTRLSNYLKFWNVRYEDLTYFRLDGQIHPTYYVLSSLIVKVF